MYLRSVELRDLRNYHRAEVAFQPGRVVLHGPNGAGKTNLLEAIGLAARGEPLRAQNTAELVRRGQDYAFVRACFVLEKGDLRVEVGLARTGRRQFKIGGLAKRRVDLIGLAPVVYFSADDIWVVRGDPSGRRRLLDLALCAVSRPYYLHLARYRKGLEQRNRLLKGVKNGATSPAGLDGWDRALARYGAKVILDRCHFVEALAPAARLAHGRLSGGAAELLMNYRPSVASSTAQTCGTGRKKPLELEEEAANTLVRAWREGREADIGYGATLMGPHRDDLELLLDGQSVRAYGSQGEQRTCALAVRMGLAEMMKAYTGEVPALLLDDVLSELDEVRRQGVFAAAAEMEQVIITCCDVTDVPDTERAGALVMEVSDGRVK